jgi:FkbM family methyltransferase
MIVVNGQRIHTLDLGGFNELRFCRDGLYLYNKNDAYVGASLKVYGEYCRQESIIFEHLTEPKADRPVVVVEVGANIGSHTVALSKRAKEVYACEPQRLVFQLLCANLALNQCTNVWAHQIGLGAAQIVMKVPYRDPAQHNNFGGVALTEGFTDPRDEPLYIHRLDDYVWSPTLLKIDVEGMELDVIKGGLQTIARCRPVIYCENDRREKSPALCEALTALGYSLYWHLPPLFNPNNFAGEKVNVFPKIVSVNMLCLPNAEDVSYGLAPVTDPDEFWGTRK